MTTSHQNPNPEFEATLLVVDDEPNIRELLSTSLRFAGFDVLSAANGTDALRIGDLVWFRHAKAGELAEHFNDFQVVSQDRIGAVWTTYRGEGLVL